MAVTSVGYKIGKQPIAQSFYISEPAGIYCTKVDLFFKSADENAPVQIEIRPMKNGFPSSSEVFAIHPYFFALDTSSNFLSTPSGLDLLY